MLHMFPAQLHSGELGCCYRNPVPATLSQLYFRCVSSILKKTVRSGAAECQSSRLRQEGKVKGTMKPLFTYHHSVRKGLKCWLPRVPCFPTEQHLRRVKCISTDEANHLTAEGAPNNRILVFSGSRVRGSGDAQE